MRFVHTFYSEPLLNNKFNSIDVAIHYTFMDYACSAAFVHKNGHKIILVTDKNGYLLLKFIPYDEVIIINPDKNKSLHFAAQFKFEALKRLNLDDILIDGDLFIRKPETYTLLEQCKEDVITSFYEPLEYTLNTDERREYYENMFKLMNLVSYKNPYHTPEINDLEWPNTSMLKFNSQELKDKYIEQYEYHCALLNQIDFGDKWPDIIIEQYFLRLLVESGNYSHKVFIEGFPSNESNNLAIQLGFTHLGAAKISANNFVEAWLKELDENLYSETLNEIAKYTQSNS